MNWAKHYLCRAMLYGVRELEDGSKIYFDRQYRNLARVWPDGRIEFQEPNYDYGDAPCIYFYRDRTSPRRKPSALKKISAMAEELGLLVHIKKRARVDYEAFRAKLWRKPLRTPILE